MALPAVKHIGACISCARDYIDTIQFLYRHSFSAESGPAELPGEGTRANLYRLVTEHSSTGAIQKLQCECTVIRIHTWTPVSCVAAYSSPNCCAATAYTTLGRVPGKA